MSGINPSEKIGLALVNHVKESVAEAALAVQNYVDCMGRDVAVIRLRSAWARLKKAVGAFKEARANKIVQKVYAEDMAGELDRLIRCKYRLRTEIIVRDM